MILDTYWTISLNIIWIIAPTQILHLTGALFGLLVTTAPVQALVIAVVLVLCKIPLKPNVGKMYCILI